MSHPPHPLLFLCQDCVIITEQVMKPKCVFKHIINNLNFDAYAVCVLTSRGDSVIPCSSILSVTDLVVNEA